MASACAAVPRKNNKQNKEDCPYSIKRIVLSIFRTDQKLNFVSGPHQKWCEMLRKNALSRVVHAISGVIQNP